MVQSVIQIYMYNLKGINRQLHICGIIDLCYKCSVL
jgi:hypothetical protein